MGVFKNGVGRPSNETIKKRNIFKGICVVLFIVIIGLVVYILNDKGIINISGKDDKKTVDKKTDKENKKEEKLSDEEGKKIVEEVFGNFSSFHIIDSKKLELNSDNIKTYAAIMNVKEGSKKYTCKELFGNNIESFADSYGKGSWRVENLLCSDGYQTLYSYSDVNSQYKKMFGKDVDALKSTIKMDNIFDGAYGYSKSENGYSFLSCECGDSIPPIISGFKNVKKIGNELTIDYAEILADDNEYFNFDDGTKVKYDYKKDENEQFLKYKDKINKKYTLVFEKQSDDSYIFIKAK